MSLARLLTVLLLALPIVGHRAVAAGAVIYEVNGTATAPSLVFSDDAIAWTITPSQNMLLDGLATTFGRVSGATTLGTVLPRSVRISLHEGSAQGALKARIDVFVDAQGGAKGGDVEPVLLLGGKPYVVTLENIRNIGATVADDRVAQARSVQYLQGWASGSNYATVHTTYSDGALQPLGAPILRLSGKTVVTLAQVDCLMAWAEFNYPAFFAPRSSPSQTLAAYYYRHYPQTGTYLGVSTADENVYVLEGNNILTNIGTLATWLVASRCGAKR